MSLQTDLEHTLGESAALGASGVVLWGELSFAKSKVSVCGFVGSSHLLCFDPLLYQQIRVQMSAVH